MNKPQDFFRLFRWVEQFQEPGADLLEGARGLFSSRLVGHCPTEIEALWEAFTTSPERAQALAVELYQDPIARGEWEGGVRGQLTHKAKELYRLSIAVCERLALPHTAIRVALHALGSSASGTKNAKRRAESLRWDGAAWSYGVEVAPPGPLCPWGSAALELTERPALIEHRKYPGQDLYHVPLFRWVSEAHYKGELGVYQYTTWRYKRCKRHVSGAWYDADPQDVCVCCKGGCTALEGPASVYIDHMTMGLFCADCCETRPQEVNTIAGRGVFVGGLGKGRALEPKTKAALQDLASILGVSEGGG